MGAQVCLIPALLSKHCTVPANSKEEQPRRGLARAQPRGELGTREELVAAGPGAGWVFWGRWGGGQCTRYPDGCGEIQGSGLLGVSGRKTPKGLLLTFEPLLSFKNPDTRLVAR